LTAPSAEVSTSKFRSTILEWKSTTRLDDTAVADEDIRHAVANAMVIEDQDDDTRLYLVHVHGRGVRGGPGPGVVTV